MQIIDCLIQSINDISYAGMVTVEKTDRQYKVMHTAA